MKNSNPGIPEEKLHQLHGGFVGDVIFSRNVGFWWCEKPWEILTGAGAVVIQMMIYLRKKIDSSSIQLLWLKNWSTQLANVD